MTVLSLTQSALFAIAVSVDAFVACFAYGANKIKIPAVSVAIIDVVCSGVVCLSLLFGAVLAPFFPPGLTKAVCFCLLFLLGIVKLFDSSIKSFIRKHNDLQKQFNFSLFQLRFILNIYADPQKADSDASRVLSPMEAAALAAALSLDGLAVGFGAGLGTVSLFEVLCFAIFFGALAVLGGCGLGRKIAEKTDLNLSWVSGVLLIILAFARL